VPAQSLQTDAFVLLQRPAADSFRGYTVFSGEHGSLFVLQRLPSVRAPSSSRAAPASHMLDLFDEASLWLESRNQGRTWFVKEARLVTRASGIGRDYESLQHASAFAAVVARNSVAEESRPAVAGLLRGAFVAFGGESRPDIVLFKCLYRFARDEGYPLKQQWFSTLPSADRAVVATLLNRPVAEQTAERAAVARLHRRLEEYLRGHTEILLE
jgi:hypothetical protein